MNYTTAATADATKWEQNTTILKVMQQRVTL